MSMSSIEVLEAIEAYARIAKENSRKGNYHVALFQVEKIKEAIETAEVKLTHELEMKNLYP